MAASKEVKLEEAFDVLCNLAQKLADEGGLNHMLCLPSDASPEEVVVMSASLSFADLKSVSLLTNLAWCISLPFDLLLSAKSCQDGSSSTRARAFVDVCRGKRGHWSWRERS